MRRSLTWLLSALAALAIGANAHALAPNPPAQRYQLIPERNLFGLKPELQPQAERPAPNLARIFLTGITTILGDKRALMKTVPAGAKPGEPAKEKSLILSEGQRDGDIEVLQVDEKAGSVKVNNSGTVMTLTFEKDGPKLPPAASVAPPAAPPGPAALPSAAGAATNAGASRAGVNPGPRTLPARSPRLPLGSAVVPPPASAAAATPATPAPLPGTPEAPALPPDLTPEEQAIVLELQGAAANPTVNASPVSPTPSSPGAGAPSSPGPAWTGGILPGVPGQPGVPGRPTPLMPQ